MSRELRHALAFVGLGLLLLAGLYVLGRQFPPYEKHHVRVSYLMAHRDSVEALTVGHSQSRAIDFDAMGVRGYHLWRPSSDLFEVDYLLRAVVPELPDLKVVFIPVSYGAFHHSNADIQSTDMSEIRRVYYAIAPSWRSFRPIDGDVKNLVLGKLSPVVRPDHWHYVVESLLDGHLRSMVTEPRYPDGFPDPRRYTAWDPDSFYTAVGEWTADKHVRNADEVLASDPDVPERAYRVVRDLARDLQRRGVTPVFYTPPYSDVYHRRFMELRPERVAETQTLMARLIEETGAVYLDFAQDSSFTHQYALFYDDHHLNATGARRFSAQLRDVVAPLFADAEAPQGDELAGGLDGQQQ